MKPVVNGAAVSRKLICERMNTLIVLSVLGLVTLFSEIFSFKRAIRSLVIIGLLAAAALSIADFGKNDSLFGGMILVDGYAAAFSALMILSTVVWLLLSGGFFRDDSNKADLLALSVFALTGAVCMVMFSNMIMLFLGIEILSISLYVLAGSRKSDSASNESALKYFLLGSFATGFLLFGMALVYGSTGSFDTGAIASAVSEGRIQNTTMLTAGIMLLLVAMAFKVSAAPFHFWAPDVYQGAPTQVTAFMASVVKTAAFAAFFRLFFLCFSGSEGIWADTLWVVAALTILLGNLAAAAQKNIKRMLAYSSVAHAGYMLLSLLALNHGAAPSLFFYTATYSLSSLLAFFILLIISNKTGQETIDGFRGLAHRNPLLAGLTIVAMLSLAGIPPTAGFFAKYYLFTAALDAGYTGLVIIAVLGSLVGVYYYFRPLMAVFGAEPEAQTFEYSALSRWTLVFLAVLSLALGVFPGLLSRIAL
ncbi:MAG: hypothetical protein RL213_1184 [Bacteroidota bacterium]|jgi:NADH-quinone oxidoreductase subunit N